MTWKSIAMLAGAILAITPVVGIRAQGGDMAPEHWSDAQRDVWHTILQWNDAFEANDAEAYFRFVDPTITVIVPSSPYRVEGIAADRREFEFGIEKGVTRVGFFQELDPHVTVNGNLAVVTYYSRGWYGTGEAGKFAILRETDVLAKKNGGWKLIHIHVSVPPK